LPKIATSAFPDFVAIHNISESRREDFLLLIGTPLYLKGADIAIKALQRLPSKWSGERLVIIGSSVGFPYLRALLGSRDRVEFLDFVPHDVAIDYIQRAKLVLIPSRTDAMPRVAVEAMAAGKAILASRVDGIPHYLRHNVNCLLSEPENDEDLASNMETLLREPALRRQLGAQARRDALLYFDENRYAERFHRMLKTTLGLAEDDVEASDVFRSG
jgi:glycosyltransferase involved in cell wall biosynthesis